MLTDADIRRLAGAGSRFDVDLIGEEQSALDDRALAEAVVCFANARGGTLLVGIEHDGRVTGARPRHGGYTDPRRVETMIAHRTVPACAVECGIVTIDGREVLAIEVPPGSPVTSTSEGVYRRRATDAHRPAFAGSGAAVGA